MARMFEGEPIPSLDVPVVQLGGRTPKHHRRTVRVVERPGPTESEIAELREMSAAKGFDFFCDQPQ